MKILISGSSGFIGKHMHTLLTSQNHSIWRLVRSKNDLMNNGILWYPEKGVEDEKSLEGFDAVIHLAGESLDGIWTRNRMDRMKKSRILTTRKLCSQLSALKEPPSVLMVASAIGYYGDRGDENLNEYSPPGKGFLPDLCVEWENAAEQARRYGIRVVNLRFGLVLSKTGGILKKLLPMFRSFLGCTLGSGRQYVSWTTIEDACSAGAFILDNSSLEGAVNIVSPNPVTNRAFTRILGRALHRPTPWRVPGRVLSLLLGQMARELFLASARVTPLKLLKSSYIFKHPNLTDAMEALMGGSQV